MAKWFNICNKIQRNWAKLFSISLIVVNPINDIKLSKDLLSNCISYSIKDFYISDWIESKIIIHSNGIEEELDTQFLQNEKCADIFISSISQVTDSIKIKGLELWSDKTISRIFAAASNWKLIKFVNCHFEKCKSVDLSSVQDPKISKLIFKEWNLGRKVSNSNLLTAICDSELKKSLERIVITEDDSKITVDDFRKYIEEADVHFNKLKFKKKSKKSIAKSEASTFIE